VADRIGTASRASLVVSGLILGLVTLCSTASAQTKTFKPVFEARRAAVFAPRGLTPQAVRGASVKLHRRGRQVKRRVSVRRVRRALRRGHHLRIKKSRHTRTSKLIIQADPPRACVIGTFGQLALPGSCWRPYADSSPFNQPIPPLPQLVADSSQIASRVAGFGLPGKHASGDADTATDWSHPLYYSQPSDPIYTVHCTERWSCPVEGVQVHIPARARPAGGSDGHLAAIDQGSGWEYDFWQVKQKPSGGGTLVASAAGRTRIDGDGLGAEATASGFGLAAGVIRPPELADGNIDHALFMVVKCTNGTAVWPAHSDNAGRSCSDLGLPDADAPAMGQHFYLDMTDAQIDALNKPGWQKTILRAMAHYGMYVGDTGGGSWGVEFESGSSYTSFGYQDPWERLGQQLGVPTWEDPEIGRRRYIFDFQKAVDWGASLSVVAPCVAQASCA
jgi:hypothetical protein